MSLSFDVYPNSHPDSHFWNTPYTAVSPTLIYRQPVLITFWCVVFVQTLICSSRLMTCLTQAPNFLFPPAPPPLPLYIHLYITFSSSLRPSVTFVPSANPPLYTSLHANPVGEDQRQPLVLVGHKPVWPGKVESIINIFLSHFVVLRYIICFLYRMEARL